MKVDILGRGIIPGLGALAPVYDKDLNEDAIKRILNYASLKVYLTGTKVAVIRRNLHELILLDKDKHSTTSSVKMTAVATTSAKSKKKEEKKVEKVVEEIPQTVTTIDETINIEEKPISEEMTLVEETSETSEEVLTVLEDQVEEKKEEKPANYYTNNKKKKNR